VSRFRLRFHLQEIDLRAGVTTLGRSEECEVTIEDPLVSRRHAQIAVDGDEVRVIDLGSRNGVRLNGHPVEGSAILADGDRVRIGTQDLVFTRVLPKPKGPQGARTTGVLRLCARCKLPFARETMACPHCGASEQTDEDTITGSFGHESQHSWSVQLLLEAIDKALGMGRLPDADRMLRRATGLFEDRLVEGGKLEANQVAHAAMAAATICEQTKDPSWGSWIPRFYERASLYPPAMVSDRLTQLVGGHPELLGLLPPLGLLVPPGEPAGEDVTALARLCALASPTS
jgi:hypothetical protein